MSHKALGFLNRINLAKIRFLAVSLFALFYLLFFGFGLATPSASAVNSTPPPTACTKNSFFGLAPWYQYLPYSFSPNTGHCEINEPADPANVLGSKSFVLLIALAIIDDLLRIAGMVAIVFVIVGGFKLITTQGEPEAAAGARKTITFALIGLAIALLSVVIVSFIGSSIGHN